MAPPPVLRVGSGAAVFAVFAVAALCFLAWWGRVPTEPGIAGALLARVADLLPRAWPGILVAWITNLGHLALLVAVEAACLLAGRRALRWVLGGSGPGRVWDFLLSLGLGHGIMGCATLGLGFGGLLEPWLFRAVLAAGLCLAGDPRGWKWPRTVQDAAGNPGPAGPSATAAGRAVAAAAALIAAFCLAGLLAGFVVLLGSGPVTDGVFTRIPAAGVIPFILACAAGAGVSAIVLRFPGFISRAAAPAFGAFAAFFAVVNLVPAFQPEWFYDSLVYHLAVPEQYLLARRVCYLGHTFISNYPFLQEMRYLFCLALGDDVLPKLVHWADGVAAAAAAWALARAIVGPAGAWLAAALFLSTPSLLFLQQVSMVEVGLAWFVALAVMALAASLGLVPGARRAPGAWLLLLGWYLGFAHGVKYIGLNASVLLLGAYAVCARGREPLRIARDLALVVVWASAWTGVWLAKNWLFTGNPLYPFFHGWLGGLNWDGTRQALWMADNTKYGTGRGAFMNWMAMPAVVATDAPGFGAISFNPFPLLFLPVVLLFRSPPLLVRMLAGFPAFYFVLWAVSAQEVRFLVPMLPAAAAAAAFVVVRAGTGSPVLRAVLAGSAGWILLNSASGALGHRYASDVTIAYAFGTMDRAEMLRRSVTHRYAVERVSAVVPPGRRVLFIGTDESFYCPRPRICDSIYDFSTLGRLAARSASPRDLARRLGRLGVTHVLIHERRGEEYAEYGLFDWPDAARRNFLGVWAAHLGPVHTARGVQLHELLRDPVSPGRRKAGTPSWMMDRASVALSREYAARIDALLVAGKTAEALAPAVEYVNRLPGAAQAWSYRGLVLAQLNRLREAERDDETAIALGYPPAVAWVNLGIMLAARGQHARALEVLEEGIPLDPVFAETGRRNAMHAALILKRYDRALPHAEALLAAHPDDAALAEQVRNLKPLVPPGPRRP